MSSSPRYAHSTSNGGCAQGHDFPAEVNLCMHVPVLQLLTFTFLTDDEIMNLPGERAKGVWRMASGRSNSYGPRSLSPRQLLGLRCTSLWWRGLEPSADVHVLWQATYPSCPTEA